MSLHDATAWIFDLDGTLTVAMHDFAGFKAAQGLPRDRPILESMGGLSGERAAQVSAALVDWEEGLADLAEAAPGAVPLLADLAGRGRRLGILTRNTHHNALRTLKAAGLDGFFRDGDIVGRDDASPKPSPDGVRLLLGRWKTLPGSAVLVGDYDFDIDAGRSAGTRTVFIDLGRGRCAVSPDLTVGGLEELALALGS